MTFTVNAAVEGNLDEAVLIKLLGISGGSVESVHGRQGKNFLRDNVRRYNHAAQYGKWVVLVDLNHEAECAPNLINSWLSGRDPNLQFRVAVRAVEAWLLADRDEMANFLKVPAHRIPISPETEDNPKITLINVARRSRSKEIREDLVPRDGSTAREGPAYTSRLVEFALNYWRPERAAVVAPSLERSIRTLLRWLGSS